MDENVRAVNVNEIIKQRSNDILLAFQAFKNGRSTRTPMQRLPRHMRRRAMSHNVKRMPKNWRQFAIQTTKRSKHRKKPPSRYFRRRRRFQGGNDSSILRTHVWHAKRYHMKKIIGANFTLPQKCFQKVQRTCIRAATKGCCVADHSYWQNFKIELNNQNEAGILQHIMDYCRLKNLPSFEYNKCHDLILYKTKSDERVANDCYGPVQIRKVEENGEKYIEFSADIRSNLSLHFQTTNLKFEILSHARITLYGPKALEKIIEAFNITKSEEDNPFNDVLDGALLLKGYWFRLKGSLSKEKEFSFDLIYRHQAPESCIDIVCYQKIQKDVWIKLVHNRCQPLGVTDEQNLRTFYGKFSFPDDCPDFVNPFILPHETKELQDKHNRRPTNRRVKYENLSPDNPFNFNFDRISTSPSDLIPVKIVPIGKGAPQRYSFIYSKVEEAEEDDNDEDDEMDDEEVDGVPPPPKRLAFEEDFIPLLTASSTTKFSKIVPMFRLFEVEIKPKLSRGMKRRAKKNAEKRGEIIIIKKEESIEPKKLKIPQGTVIGRIVRGLRWSSQHGNMLGLGYCSLSALKPILENNSIIYFRNPASHKYRKARITVIPFDDRFY
uniref:Uncharacterized protein n=1 Tax=Panagrolaimus sp. ES5 TaxID=591445 RepID=A0AC34F4N7_9BILA